jgi:predicted RNase H-like HicB family nuclease
VIRYNDGNRAATLRVFFGSSRNFEGPTMSVIKFMHWEEDGAWLGYLLDYPDYHTQGQTLEDLKEHLRDIYQDIVGGHIPGIRKVEELEVQ